MQILPWEQAFKWMNNVQKQIKLTFLMYNKNNYVYLLIETILEEKWQKHNPIIPPLI